MIALRHRRFSASWLLFIAAGILFAIGLFARLPQPAYAADTATTTGEHIMTVYDGDEKKGFLTRADTLKQALGEAGFNLSANDITDPSLDTKLVAANYSVTIYRARPVLVVDGASRTKVITAYQTSTQIAKQAGIELRDEDIAELNNSSDVVADGALETLVITRATPVKLVLYGESSRIYTQARTVSDMLADKEIKLTDKDKISVSMDTKIESGMTVEIWREGTQTVTRKEVAHFHVRTISDANQPIGYTKIKTPGKDGVKVVTYEITVKNGEEVKKEIIQTVVTEKPVEQVEIIGAKPEFSGDFSQALAKLRACESGDNYANKNNPVYRGAYQFDVATWAGYGGYVDPADAPASIQDQKAWETYQRRGWQPWPVCGAAQLPDIYR